MISAVRIKTLMGLNTRGPILVSSSPKEVTTLPWRKITFHLKLENIFTGFSS